MTLLQRQISPAVKIIDQVNFQLPMQFQLENGIKAFFMKGGSQEIFKIELLFKSGSYHQDKPLQACTTANMIRNGSLLKNSEEINKLWDFYGVSLQIEAQKDIISIGCFCLTHHLDPVLDLLMEVVSQAIFPADELNVFLNKVKQKYIVNQQKVQHLARTHFGELLFGKDHPYGASVKLEDFDLLSRTDLQAYHQNFIQPGNCTCLVSGIFPDNIGEILNKKFATVPWNGKSGDYNSKNYLSDFLPGKHYINKEDALQSSLRIGKLMVNRSHEDYHKVSITNTLLGGFFGSRLMRNIRQEKGFSYGINSSLVALLKETYFFISTQVGNQVKDQALVEIYHEMKQLRTKPANTIELEMLRNYLSASFLRSFDGPFMQMERFRELFLFGLDYSHYEKFLPTLNRLTPSDIQETAEKHFNENHMLELVVG
jgi:zinc protease